MSNVSPNMTIPIVMISTLTAFWNIKSDVPEMIPWQRNCRNEKHPATRPDIVAQNHAVGGVSFKTEGHWCISPESTAAMQMNGMATVLTETCANGSDNVKSLSFKNQLRRTVATTVNTQLVKIQKKAVGVTAETLVQLYMAVPTITNSIEPTSGPVTCLGLPWVAFSRATT